MSYPSKGSFYLLRPLIFNTIILVLLALLLISYQSWASALKSETPTTANRPISYQGTLTNEVGQPINEALPMTFRLYDSADALTPLWTEVYSDTNPIMVQNGQFQVWLASQAAFPPDLWNHSALYLGIQIADDEEMQPRERLGAAPYALQADSVASLPERSIDSSKLALQQTVQRFDPTLAMSATATISEGVGVEIPGTELLFKLERNSRILYTAQAVATFSDAPALHTVQVVADGVVQQQFHSLGQALDTVSIFTYLDLAAGDHRITLNYLATDPDSQIQILNQPTPGSVSYLVVDQP
ncbi:MAG: hypothetical protein U0175_25780 [Caldilineaceae bacterium]